MKRLLTLVLTGTLVLGLVGAASAGRSQQVFEDPAGDAGIEGGPAVGQHQIPGSELGGFDLVSGEITRSGQALECKVTSAAMPPTGSLPDGVTFRWPFVTNGESYRLSAKSQDIGKPNLVSGEGQERLGTYDIDGHFRLEKCSFDGALPGGFGIESCELIALEDGSFDPASKSFSISIPLKDIGAFTGSVIRSDVNSSSCPCWVQTLADRTFSAGFFLDSIDKPFAYKIPGG